MGTGIKVAVINQIKEYAEQKAYDKALTLIRQQDLSQSYNSQFVRICGEVLLYTKNYEECRKVLIMAHKIAPEGNRIIYDLIQLYIETGESALADKYYEQYVFNSTEHDLDLPWLNYMIARSKRASGQELYAALESLYTEDRADNISYEFLRIFQWMGETEKFEAEYQYMFDTFRDSEYRKKAKNLKETGCAKEELFVYPEHSVLHHDEKLDADETSLLEQDYYRMYPKEPEIVLMADDYDAQDDQSIAWKIWTQKRREKAEQKAAAKAEKKAAKQAKKEAEAAEKQKAEQEKADSSGEAKQAEPEKADSSGEAKQAEPEKADSGEVQQAEPEKADSSEVQQAEPEKADSSGVQQTEQEKADSGEGQQTEQEKPESSEGEQAEQKESDSAAEHTIGQKHIEEQETSGPEEAEPEEAEYEGTYEEAEPEEAEYESAYEEAEPEESEYESAYEEAEPEEAEYEGTYEEAGPEEAEYEAAYEEAGSEEAEYEGAYEEAEPEESEYESAYEEAEPEESEYEAAYEEAGPEEAEYEGAYEEAGPEEAEYEAAYEEAEQEESKAEARYEDVRPEYRETGYGDEEDYIEISLQDDMKAYETVIDINAPLSYDSEPEAEEAAEDEEDEADAVTEPDKHQQAFDEYDELLKKEEARLVDQFEREARLLKEAESLLASVQSGVDDWNSQKVNNLFEAFDMEYKDAMNTKKEAAVTPPVKAKKDMPAEPQDEPKQREPSFEDSFESLNAKKTQVEELAQKVESLQNKKEPQPPEEADKTDHVTEEAAGPETKVKKTHVELREHTKSMLSLDARKKDILKQLKERR